MLSERRAEPVSLIARVPGYRVSANRNRFQLTRNKSLAMFVEGPRDELVIYYEPEPVAAGGGKCHRGCREDASECAAEGISASSVREKWRRGLRGRR